MKLIVNLLACLVLLSTASAQQQEYHVLFEYDKAIVPDTAMAYLIKNIYTHNVEMIYLEGHCDSIGSKGYNYTLSERRVKAVENLLVENGFDKKKINGKVGFGKDKPLAPNSTAAARQRNRRVLVRFEISSTDNKQVVKKDIKKRNANADAVKPKQKHNKPTKPVVVIKQVKPNAKLKKNIIQAAKRPKELKAESFTANSTIALPNLLFQGGRHFLVNQSSPSLDKLVSILYTKPEIKIEIQGHVCCTTFHEDGYDWDTRTDNLSVNRAIAIKAYLVKKGISSTRLRTKGFGGSKKLFPIENNEYQRQQNRRVEVMVLPNN